jgi:PAS domain S-box-containing protein
MPKNPAHSTCHNLFPGDSEMARRIRDKDWSQSPLGGPEEWPKSLLTAVNILLGSRYPMEIWWGPEYLRFYNDAYRPILGPHRHPQFLGQPGIECWGELWNEIGPMLDGVMETGVPTYAQDALLLMTRKGFVEETYVSWSYGPIWEATGKVGGIFCACDETTRQVLNARRLECLHELAGASNSIESATPPLSILSRFAKDVPFAALFGRNAGGSELSLLSHYGIDTPELLPALLAAHGQEQGDSAADGLAEPQILENLSSKMPSPIAGPWPEPVNLGMAFPLKVEGNGWEGVLVLGVSSRLELDQEYKDFLGLIARHIASTLDVEASRNEIEKDRLRLRSAFMQSPAFMCILRGESHVFQFINEMYSRLIGGREVLGKPVAEALPEIVAQGFIDILDRVYTTGEPYIGKEAKILLQRSEGGALDEVTVNFVYQPIQEPDGRITGIFVHGIDITEEKAIMHEREELLLSERAARSEAERASRMKDEFLATLSHELRTPLNAILGWATLLRSGRLGADEMIAGIETIERNARAQTQIIEDLLDMSRIISGKVRLDVQRIDLQEVLREAIQTAEAAAQAKGIRLQHVLDPLAGPVTGDPSRLQQVFWNLLNNAIKFSERGGRVQVLLERVNSHIEISVIDTGRGITPEFLPHVFDRFQQADSTTTRRYGGLGLGLAIVKQLVELHGGTVRAKSAGEGKGATFVVHLPLTAIHPENEDQPGRRHPSAGKAAPILAPLSLDAIRVLAVDDEPDARALVKTLLESVNASVAVAASGPEALRQAGTEKFDVIVCDIGMPGMDGYSVIEEIREGSSANARTPAVALTAYARSEDRTKALRAGFQLHIAKPVEPSELITVVASLSGGPRRIS